MVKTLKALRVPETLETNSFLDSVVINPRDFDVHYVRVFNASFPFGNVFTTCVSTSVQQGFIGLLPAHQTWMKIAEGDVLEVEVEVLGVYVAQMHIDIIFYKKSFKTKERYDVTQLSRWFIDVFNKHSLNKDQTLVFTYAVQDNPVFKATVRKMTDAFGIIQVGVVTPQTVVTFFSETVSLGGSSGQNKSIFDKGWNFEELGVGGLGKQFQEMFRRAFISRIFPQDIVEKLGITHTKGMMLYGPPGTGKTLMARKIGQMLNGNEPKIVNGPEIMSKYVGQSEENVRNLFADAESEQAERGDNSKLHIIIFDEIDAICKQRGTSSGGTGVADSVVNQLLSKIDGVESLNNVFLIGMTNRLDMIDEALLRPGRFELKLQIGLPDDAGRLEILKIHTKKLRTNQFLQDDVDLEELAHHTKNFSGAEIAGLIRSAVSFATEKCMKEGNGTDIDDEKINGLCLHMADFERALAEVRPAFGADEESFQGISPYGVVDYDAYVDVVVQTGNLLVKQVTNSPHTSLVSLLISGCQGSGKTTLAAYIAMNSQFPYIKLISPDKFVGKSEIEKASRIAKVFDDAYKSPFSVVIVDDIERLIDFNKVGARFSNAVLQTLLVLFKKTPPPGHKMMVIATTGDSDLMKSMGVVGVFSKVQNLDVVKRTDQIQKLLDNVGFLSETKSEIMKALANDKLTYSVYDSIPISIPVKKLFAVAEMALQSEDPVDNFLFALDDECKAMLI